MSIKKMIPIICSSLFLISIVAFFNPNDSKDNARRNSLSEKIELKIEDYIKNDDYQGAVLIAKDGKILFNKAYGLADREEKIENTTQTQFLIGSLTKSFVAITILQLVEKGLLDLNAPLQLYIPNLKDDLAKNLTLHILLKHQSGLVPHLERIIDFEDKDVSSNDIIDIINTSSLSFIPASKYEYSNLNYTLAAIAIENVTNRSFSQVLQENTFTPLKMYNSGVEERYNYPKKRAKGYRKTVFGIKNKENLISYTLGSGDIYSTVEDLYRWDQAIYENKLVSHKSKQLLFNGESTEFGNYSYGFRITDYQRGKSKGTNGVLMRHGGTMDGFMSNLHRYSNDKLTIIILGNVRTFSIRQMTRDLKEIVLEIKPEERIHPTHE